MVMVGLEKKYRAAEDANTTRHGEKVRRPRRNRFPLVEDDPSSVFWVVDDTEEEEEVSENVNDEEEGTSRATDHYPSRPLGLHFPRGYILAFYPTPAPSTMSLPRLRSRVKRIQPSSMFKMCSSRFGCVGS